MPNGPRIMTVAPTGVSTSAPLMGPARRIVYSWCVVISALELIEIAASPTPHAPSMLACAGSKCGNWPVVGTTERVAVFSRFQILSTTR